MPTIAPYTPIQISELARHLRLPNDWRLNFQQGRFIAASPADYRLPPHGYKIRVNFLATRLVDAIECIRITSEICSRFNIPFKFMPSLRLCQRSCEKNYPVEGAGKLITLYTDSNSVFEAVCRALDARISTTAILPAPHPLSDIQVTENLSIRYGSYFTQPLMMGPDGSVFEDVRDAFQLPPWVNVPSWVANRAGINNAPAPENDENDTIVFGKYEVLECIHRTFAGALYDAVETQTGARIVLKEARGRVEIAGVNAKERLVNESEVLRFLETEPLTPTVREYFETEGHGFLVTDAILSTAEDALAPTLFHWWQSLARERDNAMLMRVASEVIAVLKRLHRRNVAWVDFSPMNILVVFSDANRLELRLIDAEYAVMNATRAAFRLDVTALGRLLIWLLVPENDALLDPNIAIRDSDFEVLAATPAVYQRAALACFRKDTDINSIRISTL